MQNQTDDNYPDALSISVVLIDSEDCQGNHQRYYRGEARDNDGMYVLGCGATPREARAKTAEALNARNEFLGLNPLKRLDEICSKPKDDILMCDVREALVAINELLQRSHGPVINAMELEPVHVETHNDNVRDPHWEAVHCPDFGWRVRWSEADKEGRWLWVGHYGVDESGTDADWRTAQHFAESSAAALNQKRKAPWEYREYTPS